MQHPIRIGVLGCAKIARQFVRDVAPSDNVKVVAAASRDPSKVADFCNTLDVKKRYDTYEALLRDPEVDAVYVPLPNAMHCEWSVRSAECGKHILCEKPLAITAAEATRMFDAARQHGVLLVEGYPYWFQPQTDELMEFLHGPNGSAIGEMRSIHVAFGFTIADPENIRMNPTLGGGALLDAGSYNLSLIRLVMGCAPIAVKAEAILSDTGVDISMMATLRYANGQRAQMSCAMNAAAHRRAIIVGSEGVIETEFLNHTSDEPNHPWHYLPSEMRLRRGVSAMAPFETIHSRTGSGFQFAAEAFAKMITENDLAGMERMAAISLDVARTIDAIILSAKSGEEAILSV